MSGYATDHLLVCAAKFPEVNAVQDSEPSARKGLYSYCLAMIH